MQLSSLTLCLLLTVLALVLLVGPRQDSSEGGMPIRELGSRMMLLANFGLGHESNAGFLEVL